MPRLVHKTTGSIIDCSDEVAAVMAGEFEPETASAPAKKAAPKAKTSGLDESAS